LLVSISLSVLTNEFGRPMRVKDAIERLASAGFEALDFNLFDWCFKGSPFAEDGWEDWVEEAARTAQRCNIKFTQAHGPMWSRSHDKSDMERLLRLSHRALDTAGRLGIPWVVFHPQTANGAWDSAHIDCLRRRNEDWFKQLIPTAEENRAGIAIENIMDVLARNDKNGRWFGSVPAEMISLVDSLDHPLVGVCWDTGHANVQGLDQPAAIRALGSRLKALHIHENNGIEDQHLAPYFGKIDWPAFMTALAEINYTGDFALELRRFNVPDTYIVEILRSAYRLGCTMREMRSQSAI